MSEQERIRGLEAELAEARQHVKAALANGNRAIAEAKRLLEITEELAASNARLQAQIDQLTARAERAEQERNDACMRELAAHSTIGVLTHTLERVAKYLNGLTALASIGDGTVSLDGYAQRAVAEQIADALRFASTADRADAGEG